MMPSQPTPTWAPRSACCHAPPPAAMKSAPSAGLGADSPAERLAFRSQSPASPTSPLALPTPGRSVSRKSGGSSSSSSGTWARLDSAGSPTAAAVVLDSAFQRTLRTIRRASRRWGDKRASSPTSRGNTTGGAALRTIDTSGLELLAAAAEESGGRPACDHQGASAAHAVPKAIQHCCSECGATSSPGNTWRHGPKGPRTLCNRCGIAYARHNRKGLKQRAEKSALAAAPAPAIIAERAAATARAFRKRGRSEEGQQEEAPVTLGKRGRSEEGQQEEAPVTLGSAAAVAAAAVPAEDAAAGAAPRKSRRVAERSARRQAATAQEAAAAAAAAAEEAAELEAASALLVMPACTWVQHLITLVGPEIDMLA